MRLEEPNTLYTEVVRSQEALLVYHANDRRLVVHSLDGKEVVRVDFPWPIKEGLSVAMRAGELRALVHTANKLCVVNERAEVLIEQVLPKAYRGRVVAFSPDLKRMALNVLDQSTAISIYDLESGLKVLELVGHRSRFYGLCFSNDSQRLASGGEDGVVFQTGELIQEKIDTVLNHMPQTLSISPDDQWLAASGTAGLQVWNRHTGQ